MDNSLRPVRVSLRQADGEFYPVFCYGDPGTCNLSLLPASENQNRVEISFYFHPEDGSAPVDLGTLRFADLPLGAERQELQLDAVIDSKDMLSLTVGHKESGQMEHLEVLLSKGGSGRNRYHRYLSKILGFLFVVAGAALIAWLVILVARWGWQEPVEAPLSLLSAYLPSSV